MTIRYRILYSGQFQCAMQLTRILVTVIPVLSSLTKCVSAHTTGICAQARFHGDGEASRLYGLVVIHGCGLAGVYQQA